MKSTHKGTKEWGSENRKRDSRRFRKVDPMLDINEQLAHAEGPIFVTLKGKTAKGKQRVKKFGRLWLVEQVRKSVFCLDNEPGLLIRSGEALDGDRDLRWVKQKNDSNFEVTVEE